MAHLVRHALNHGNVFEGPLTDRIADAGNRGCQGQVATLCCRSRANRGSTAVDPLRTFVIGPGAERMRPVETFPEISPGARHLADSSALFLDMGEIDFFRRIDTADRLEPR